MRLAPGRIVVPKHLVPKGTYTLWVTTRRGSCSAKVVKTWRGIPEQLLELQVTRPSILPLPAVWHPHRRGDSGAPLFDSYGRVYGVVTHYVRFTNEPKKAWRGLLGVVPRDHIPRRP